MNLTKGKKMMIESFVLSNPLTTLLMSCMPFLVLVLICVKTKKKNLGVASTILAIPAALGGLWLGTHFDSPEYFPKDLYWYEGTVKEVKKGLDGDVDIFFEDGSWIVSVIHSPPKVGDKRYLLHASTKDGKIERTFDCAKRTRDRCGYLSLAIKTTFKTNTMNQGFVEPSIKAKNT